MESESIKTINGAQPIYDVAVVGAGPAGAMAALELAKRGVKVVLIEKFPLPRYKPCGGGVTIRTLKFLPAQALATVQDKCHFVEIHLSSRGLSFKLYREQPLIYMVIRQDFDYALTEAACKQGVNLLAPARLLTLQEELHRIRLKISQGTIACRFVIGADGAVSTVSRSLGFAPNRYLAPTLQAELELSSKDLEKYRGTARFDLLFVPGGYGWAFPKRGLLSVGVGRMSPGKINLNKYLKQYLGLLGLEGVRPRVVRGSVVPVRARQEALAKGRALLVGDAAGLADPFTGEGISHAIRSGLIAAHAIFKGNLKPEKVKRLYQGMLRSIVIRELRWARIPALWFYKNHRIAEFVFQMYAKRLANTMADIVSGQGAYWKALTNPLTYLKIGPVFRDEVREVLC